MKYSNSSQRLKNRKITLNHLRTMLKIYWKKQNQCKY